MPAKLVIHAKSDDEIAKVKAQRDAKDAMKAYDAALAKLTTQWNGLDSKTQLLALRDMVIIMAKNVRWLTYGNN